MTARPDLSQVTTLSFDCYGTLIDWERGLLEQLRPWAQRVGAEPSDDTLLSLFAEIEPACEESTPTAPYRDVLRDVHHEIAARLGAPPDDHAAAAFASSVGDWPPFDDTVEALRRLSRRCALVILSNVDRQSFDRTQRRLGVAFTRVITAEDVGAYKPDPKMFDALRAALLEMGVAPSQHLHAAQSLYHDIVPAASCGMRACWVDRRSGRAGGATRTPPPGADPDFTVPSMAALADLMEAPAP